MSDCLRQAESLEPLARRDPPQDQRGEDAVLDRSPPICQPLLTGRHGIPVRRSLASIAAGRLGTHDHRYVESAQVGEAIAWVVRVAALGFVVQEVGSTAGQEGEALESSDARFHRYGGFELDLPGQKVVP